MPLPPLATCLDDFITATTADRALGGNFLLSTGDAATVGTPSPSVPVRVSVFLLTAFDDTTGALIRPEQGATYLLNGVNGGTGAFTAAYESGVDQAFPSGSVLASIQTAHSFSDLAAWVTANAAAILAVLPSQTGNSGKYLTTNGTAASWATVAGGGGVTVGGAVSGGTASEVLYADASGNLACASGVKVNTSGQLVIPTATADAVISAAIGGRGLSITGGGTQGEIATAGQIRSDGGFNTSTTGTGTTLLDKWIGKANLQAGIAFPGDGSNGTYNEVYGETAGDFVKTLLAQFIPSGTHAGTRLYNGCYVVDGTNAVLGGFTPAGAAIVASMADSAAANGSLFWGSDHSGSLCEKTPGGTVTVIGGGGGSGTVTTASVVTANGFAGTVANPTTTPAITITTSVTGLLLGNGTSVAAATQGIDYLAPNGVGTSLTALTGANVVGNIPGSAANVTGTVALANGGTGQTTAGAAFNALSPNTTLGDLTYGSAANTSTRLAGNTTSTKKFLTQTGTGTVSAAPAWGTIAAADVPVFVASGASHAVGVVPDPGSSAGTAKYLREDATWATPAAGILVETGAAAKISALAAATAATTTLALAASDSGANASITVPTLAGYPAASAFNINSLSWVALFEANRITPVADGTVLSAWADASSNTNNATQSGAARPAYKVAANGINGQPVVRFAASQSMVTAAGGLSLTTDFYMGAVFRHTSLTGGYQTYLSFGQDSPGGARRAIAKFATGNRPDLCNILFFNDNSSGVYTTPGVYPMAVSTAYFAEVTKVSGVVTVYLNGVQVASASDSMGSVTSPVLTLGANNGGAESLLGDLALGMFGPVPSGANLINIRTYVQSTYGIAVTGATGTNAGGGLIGYSATGLPQPTGVSVTAAGGALLIPYGDVRINTAGSRFNTHDTGASTTYNATLSVGGLLSAQDYGGSGVHSLVASTTAQNVLMLTHRNTNGYSALTVTDELGSEKGAFGRGNSASGGTGNCWQNTTYMEASDLTLVAAPPRLLLAQTGVLHAAAWATYGRLEATTGGDLILYDTNGPYGTQKAGLTVTGLGNVVLGSAALATSATDGFFNIQTCAGTPTGAPTAYTGRAPLVFDSTAKKLWSYTGGSWVSVALT